MPFGRPGTTESYDVMAAAAVRKALALMEFADAVLN